MRIVVVAILFAFAVVTSMTLALMSIRCRTAAAYRHRREKLLMASEKRQLHTAVTRSSNAMPQTEAGGTAVGSGDSPSPLPSIEPWRVVFLHPDLGIGGAERLILDAAIGLQQQQRVPHMDIVIVTNHHDPIRAFQETTDGTVRVEVRGGWLPSNLFGRARVLCATLRMGLAVCAACWTFPDTCCFVVDQVAAAMPLLRFCAGKTPILFYSHFPDQLCDPNRLPDGRFKGTAYGAAPGHQTYRRFFDAMEARAMDEATSIVCNSQFSRRVTVGIFPRLAERIHPEFDIFYPPVQVQVRGVAPAVLAASVSLQELKQALRSAVTFVSINRYERKKNIELAVEAFARLLAMDEFKRGDGTRRLQLIVAGGYDPRLAENVQYAQELATLATEKLFIPATQVRFLMNINDDEKAILLSEMRALVYTPSREHFGIVPVEAMAYAKPVIAVADGGPCESVGNIDTEDPAECGGLLSSPNPEAFAARMALLARDAAIAERYGAQGRERVLKKFSRESFSIRLAERVAQLVHAADTKLMKDSLAGVIRRGATMDKNAKLVEKAKAS